MKFERNEYPRPQFVRNEWMPLNGSWDFDFDDKNIGIIKKYYNGTKKFKYRILVPYAYQTEASGINSQDIHEVVWYKRHFDYKKDKRRVLLCFNGVDYISDIWINKKHVMTHQGAYSSFSVDISDYLKKGSNLIVVRCYDPFDPTIPRGKQSWTGKRYGCWYIPSTGIWQSVWLEYFNCDCIDKYSLIPNIDNCSFSGDITTLYGIADSVEISVSYKNKLWKKQSFSLDGKYTRYTVQLMENDFADESFFWTIEHPNLFYVTFRLYKEGKLLDEAKTRFGLRKISIDEAGNICLNNSKIYQKLILDQGYFKESGITAPSIEILRQDILLSKQMGFNGARKHQKIEDPYYYYYAEELGFLTWCEMPSAFNFNDEEIKNISKEWEDILQTAKNFTSNVCYVTLNESWGVRKMRIDPKQQNFARALYFLTKSIDDSRLISTNDGWEMVSNTDIVGIHDYSFDSSEFNYKYQKDLYSTVYPKERKLFVDNNEYEGQPVLLTEFGGIAMKEEEKNGAWGYNHGANSKEEFMNRYRNLIYGILHHKDFQGFCYTQLTDVQQEVNGLLYEDRTPKFDLDEIRIINEG